ncbi:MAG: hypothetical protein IJ658_02380 [Kiritimatiellae bacterium]|nr:hypothetical protein [Kiritimatiellia bacterium]
MKRRIILLAALSSAACAWAAGIVRLSAVGDLDGTGELTCVVDSDKGVSGLRASVTTADGAVVASLKSKASFAVNWLEPGTLKSVLPFKVGQPRLWSDESPVLYRAGVELLDAAGETVARETVSFAFSRLEVRRDDGFYLNGQKLRFRGINAPRDSWPEDALARAEACREAARDVKRANANAIWCTNAVPSELLDACDSLGLYVMRETPSAEEGRHPCIVGWRKSDSLKRLAAPAWGTMRWMLKSDRQMTLVVPLLPQEGAGGLGAGLAECWAEICAAPRCAGGVLQANDGWTPEGLGARWRAIREIWSPVGCSMEGRMLAFQSRTRFVGMDTFKYSWQALTFSARGERVLAEGAEACPPAMPGGSALAQLPTLPAGTQAVRISLDDAGGRRVCDWCFRVPREQKVGWPASGCAPPPGLEDVYFLAGSRTNRVKNANNRAMQGPVFDFFSPEGSSLDVTWGRMADGSYRLDYTLSCRANVEMLGFAFPPLADVTAERWLGGGQVWGNMMQGSSYGLWRCGAEGVGFVRDVDWFEIETKAGTYRFTILNGPSIFADRAPRGADVATSCALPGFGPGVFARIPGIGGETFASNETGPAGCSAWLHFCGLSTLKGQLLVRWTPAR